MTGSVPPDRRIEKIRQTARRWALRMGDDPDRHRAGLDAWLARDPAHDAAYRSLARKLDTAARVAAVPGYERQRAAVAARRSRVPLIAAAAAGLAILVAVPALLRDRSRPPVSASIPSTLHSVIAASGEGRRIGAPDGSTLVLAPGAIVALRYDSGRRALELIEGRARFSVAHEPGRPFVVTAGGGTVTALGTIFEVTLGAEVQVSLVKGVVDVRAPDARGRQTMHPTRLTSGGQVRYSARVATPDRHGVHPAMGAQRVRFDNVPLDAVITELNRTSAQQLVLADRALGQRRVFLDLRDDSPAHVTAKLAALFDLEPVASKPGTTLLRPRAQK